MLVGAWLGPLSEAARAGVAVANRRAVQKRLLWWYRGAAQTDGVQVTDEGNGRVSSRQPSCLCPGRRCSCNSPGAQASNKQSAAWAAGLPLARQICVGHRIGLANCLIFSIAQLRCRSAGAAAVVWVRGEGGGGGGGGLPFPRRLGISCIRWNC